LVAVGFGARIPFLPRKFAAKLAMIDVVETVQGAATTAQDRPWPGEDFKVRAEHQSESVRWWFENPSGAVIPAATLGLDLASA
jgi:hypothetical protein